LQYGTDFFSYQILAPNSGGARVYGARGIDHFAARSFSLPSSPLKSNGLKVPLKLSYRVWGSAVSSPVGYGAKPQLPKILVHFKDLETLLMAPKMCIVLRT